MKNYFSILFFTLVLITCTDYDVLAQILDTKQIYLNNCIQISGEERLVIKTEDEFLNALRDDANRNNCLQNIEKIDFKANSLIGIGLRTGYCRTPVGLAFEVEKNRAEKYYGLNIVFIDPRGKVCRTPSKYDLWIIVPKLPADYEVRFDIKAVLPKPSDPGI